MECRHYSVDVNIQYAYEAPSLHGFLYTPIAILAIGVRCVAGGHGSHLVTLGTAVEVDSHVASRSSDLHGYCFFWAGHRGRANFYARLGTVGVWSSLLHHGRSYAGITSPQVLEQQGTRVCRQNFLLLVFVALAHS